VTRLVQREERVAARDDALVNALLGLIVLSECDARLPARSATAEVVPGDIDRENDLVAAILGCGSLGRRSRAFARLWPEESSAEIGRPRERPPALLLRDLLR
jgi:hypothetical protein